MRNLRPILAMLWLWAFFCSSGTAQRANMWYFGNFAGIDFNGPQPVPVKGSLNTNEGCAVVCDETGNLLLYTDGKWIYDATHTAINSATVLKGHPSSTQSAIVVPRPGHPTRFFIFTVDQRYSGCINGINYSEVDAANGAVTLLSANNNLLACSLSTEKITAVAHANGTDYWVTTFMGNGEFASWLVKSTGVYPLPVISTVKAQPCITNNDDRVGYMKISPSGKYLVLGRRASSSVNEAFLFDNSTGMVTQNLGIYHTGTVYGVEFSSDEKYFYTTENFRRVVQYDWAFNKIVIHDAAPNRVGALQMGPDGNIYVANGYENQNEDYIDQITDVNTWGATYKNNFIALLPGSHSRLGLPVVVSSLLIPLQVSADKMILCPGDTSVLSAKVAGVYSGNYNVKWSATNSLWTDTGLTVKVIPLVNTTYKAILTLNGVPKGDTQKVTVTLLTPPALTLGNDTVICTGHSTRLTAKVSGTASPLNKVKWNDFPGAWMDSGLQVSVSPDTTTTYTAVLTGACLLKPDTQRVTVEVLPPATLTVGPDTTICIGETAFLRAYPKNGGGSQQIVWMQVQPPSSWTDTQVVTTVAPAATSSYRVRFKDFCNINSDSAEVTVTVRPPLHVTVTPDTTICYLGSTYLTAVPQGGDANRYSVSWTIVQPAGSWADTGVTVMVSPSGATTYQATVTDGCTSVPGNASATVTTRPPLQVSAHVPGKICFNDTAILTATPTGGYSPGYTLAWSRAGGWTSILNPAKDAPDTSVTYTVTLNDGCSPTVQDTVTITVLPIPKADLTAFPLEGCPPLTVTFTDRSTDHDSLLNRWDTTYNDPKGITSFSHTFTSGGPVKVGLQAVNALGCSDYIENTFVLKVYAPPVAGFAVKPDIREAGMPVHLYNRSMGAASYTWYTGDGHSFA
ncbi:MAG TPA: hypothetical protein VEC12_05740, partial [Bacteroidia bacterium]|nr:hypothetical protein [Bacteroidia bacterium]